jgi:hypothetical protein
MSLASLSALAILSDDKFGDEKDPILLDMLSVGLDLPFKEDIHGYIPLEGPVTVDDIRKVYALPQSTLARISSRSGDLRVLEAILKTGFDANSLKDYVSLPTLILLERYGVSFNKRDLEYRIDQCDNVLEYIADRVDPKEIRAHAIQFTLGKDTKQLQYLLSKTTPASIGPIEVFSSTTLADVVVLQKQNYIITGLRNMTKESNEELFELLLQLGDIPDSAVLYSAIVNKNKKLVFRLMEEFGIIPDIEDLQVVVEGGELELIRMVYSSELAKDECLTQFAVHNLDTLKFLIELGESVGWCTLHAAMEQQSYEVVEFLLKNYPETKEYIDSAYLLAEGDDRLIHLLNQYL